MSTVLATQQIALMIPIVAIGGAFLVAIVGIVAGAMHAAADTRQREQTRRELAAYVAEGTISPDDAAKILAAGGKKKTTPTDWDNILKGPMRDRT